VGTRNKVHVFVNDIGALLHFDIGGEVDFHAYISTDSSTEQAACLTSPLISKVGESPF
jgi:hypothetical protein